MYKKDGSLDMRYSSSRAAVSSGYSGSSSRPAVSSGYSGSSSSSGLNYKKDGSLDMRYSSSRAAVSSDYYSAPSQGSGSISGFNNVHLKKDGTPDMRYSSSKQATSLGHQLGAMNISGSQNLDLKKDGTLDMRFTSSKAAAMTGPTRQVPGGIPLTKSGLPDMRTRAGKEFVAQSASSGSIPDWLPRKKDGRLDISKPVVNEFLHQHQNNAGSLVTIDYDYGCRERYYKQRMEDDDFRRYVSQERRNSIEYPETALLKETPALRREMASDSNVFDQIPSTIKLLNYDELKPTFGKELGKGSFGVVVKGRYHAQDVAVKQLTLTQLNKMEKISFVKELNILGKLGEHPNLVKLVGYTLEPPCIIMEFVSLGSLYQILYYCKDSAIEAKVSTGASKKLILLGVANGMQQVHAVNIVHGDLKPANILLSGDLTPKITDFGLAHLRGKTASSIASVNDGETIVGGTGAYMAPELIDKSGPPELSCDVYSYGILLNEVIQEDEPYTDQMSNFNGRGPFAAVNYAKLGNRPFIKPKTPNVLQQLIKKCWNGVPQQRPTFDEIDKALRGMEIPNAF